MFPATSTATCPASRIAPSSAVVVVFPFVPVTPTSGFCEQARAELDLRDDGDVARSADSTGARLPAHPGS